MWNCRNCGKENADFAANCAGCGAPNARQSAPMGANGYYGAAGQQWKMKQPPKSCPEAAQIDIWAQIVLVAGIAIGGLVLISTLFNLTDSFAPASNLAYFLGNLAKCGGWVIGGFAVKALMNGASFVIQKRFEEK